MKKMKRIMAMATAAAMMVSMFAVTAFAEGGSDSSTITSANTLLETDESGNPILKIPVTYSIETGVSVQDLAFDYTLAPTSTTDTASTNTTSTVAYSTGPALDEATVTFAYGDTFTTSGDLDTATKYAEFDLSDLLSDEYGQGVYRYTLSEAMDEDSDNTSVPASETTYQLDIYVTYNETSEANEISYVIAREITENGVGDKLSTLSYEHGSTGTDLIITSHVEGNFLDVDHEFTYTINIPVEGMGDAGAVGGVTLHEGQEISATLYTRKDDDSGDFDATPVTIIVGQTYEWTMKDTEYLVVTGLNIGTIFTVTQSEDSDYGTRNTYSFIDGTVGSMVKSGTSSLGNEKDYEVSADKQGVQIYSDSNKIDFYNKRDIVVDTGVTVDVLPYVLVMVMALCGGILFVSKKRSSVR
jgi:hypothetical protein